MLRLGYHVTVSCYQVYVLYCLAQMRLQTDDDPMVQALAKYSLRFLTNWNFFLQTAFFFTSVFLDVSQITKSFPKVAERLQKITSPVLFSIIIPLTFFVSIFFWTVFLYNRELVFPKVLDKYLAPWMNHALHTIIMATLLIEMFLVHHPLSKTGLSIALLTGFMAVYLFILVNTYVSGGIWIYPIFAKLNWPYRILAFTICLTLEILLLLAARSLNKMIWGQSKPSADSLLG